VLTGSRPGQQFPDGAGEGVPPVLEFPELSWSPDDTPARAPLRILDPANGLAPGDPARMAAAIISTSCSPTNSPPPRAHLPGDRRPLAYQLAQP
jgi:hypothetical protein